LVVVGRKPSPVATQYLDLARWQRNADAAMLRSLQTGRPVDWGKVFRGALIRPGRSVPTATAKHHRAASPSVNARGRKEGHHHRPSVRRPALPGPRARHLAPPVVSADRSLKKSLKKSLPTSKSPAAAIPAIPVTPASARPSATRTSPSASAGRHQPAAFLGFREASRTQSGRLWVVLPLILVAASLLVAFSRRRARLPLLALVRLVVCLPSVRVVRPRQAVALPEATAPPGLDPFAVSGLALTGAGAESVARGLVMAMLKDRPTELIEVVISRTDAWDLLGIDIGDLIEEHIPGLVVTDDFPESKTYLRTPGPRRLFVSCSGGLDLLHDVLARERGHIAAISLSPWLYDTIEITADGQIIHMSDPDLANAVTGPLPTLTWPEAFTQLMTLSDRTEVSEARKHFTG
jgi:hypothetical protein